MVKKTLLTVLLSTLVLLLSAQSFSNIEEDVHRFTLDNGATLLVLPRTNVPIVNCVTLVDVGAVREEPGITGISHYLEHMAFKGTRTIGTTDYEAEKTALEECHRIFDEILEEREKEDKADSDKLLRLEQELEQAVETANQYAVDNEFSRILNLNGSKNLNAGTSYDLTMYTVSLPSNKLELWMIMEADRFTYPVFRQLYPERDVIQEEKRMYEGSPLYRFSNRFMKEAFVNNPYRTTLIGEEEDIRSLKEADLREYFDRYYGARNLVFAVVGDVEPQNVLQLANKYFTAIPSGTKNTPVSFSEPEQREERYFSYEDLAQPYIMIGYQAPAATHPDAPVFSVIADILGQGRSSRLHRSLVEEKNLAAYSISYAGAPGRVYDNLFVIAAVPMQGVETTDCLDEIDRQIEIMQREYVTLEELGGVKRRALKRSIDRLKSGLGLSIQLAYYESLFGDYTELFREIEMIESVTREDIMRVMQEAIVPANRTVGVLQPKER
jgi:predicted Zn-dependent peptidase